MLVLKRNDQTWVTILGPNNVRIRVGVCELGPGFARLGFEAPPEFDIYRDEILSKFKDVPHAPRHSILSINPPSDEAPPETGSAVDRS